MKKTLHLTNTNTIYNLRELAETKGFTLEETIQFLLDIYNLECIDLLTRRIQEKHLLFQINVFQRAQLAVLKDYLSMIS